MPFDGGTFALNSWWQRFDQTWSDMHRALRSLHVEDTEIMSFEWRKDKIKERTSLGNIESSIFSKMSLLNLQQTTLVARST